MAYDKKRILLVEDNPDDEQLTLRALKEIEVPTEIVVARDGVEALQALTRADDDLPDLVLLDLKLPRVSGLEVLQRLRANALTANLPVIILSSSDEPRDITGSYDSGANSYIRKPVDFDEFIDAVRQLGAYWLRMNLCRPAR